MPIYEYRCEHCGSAFTDRRTISERKVPEDEPCSECGQVSVKQVVGSPMIAYSQPGVLRTSDNFNDRLKDMNKARPTGTIGQSIR